MTRARLTALSTIVALFLVAPAVAQADVIGDWNAIAQAETVLLRPTAHGQSRGIAMVEGAVYDAVNAIDRGYQPYLLDLDEVGAQPWGSQDAAAATAAYRVLRRSRRLRATQGSTPPTPRRWRRPRRGPMKQGGIDAGEAAAAAMLDEREDDGFMAAFTPDRYRSGRLAADRMAGRSRVRPRRVGRQPEAVPDREPVAVPLEGAERAQERDVRKGVQRGEGARCADSSTRTADQTAAAVFWQFAPIALWNPLARELAGRYDLDTADQAGSTR